MFWELGISDGVNRSWSIAILPGVDTATDTSWTEREYVGVYDRIVWGALDGEPQRVWVVWNHESNTATKLASWLRR